MCVVCVLLCTYAYTVVAEMNIIHMYSMYVYAYICMYVCLYIMYPRVHMYVYVCMCPSVYICMYICKYTLYLQSKLIMMQSLSQWCYAVINLVSGVQLCQIEVVCPLTGCFCTRKVCKTNRILK